MKALRVIWKAATSKSVAFLLAVCSIAAAAYSLWFYHPRPRLTFEILSDTKVLDLRAPIRNLDITYGGQSLQSKGEELRIVVLRVVNDGSADIMKDAFDSNDPVGFHILQGELLDSPAVTASSEYIARVAQPVQVGSSTVLLKPVILEAREWLELKLLVAVRAGIVPSIQPFGKVDGIRHLRVLDDVSTQSRQSLWQRTTGADSWWIQLLRGPIYTLVFILSVIATILIAVFLSTTLFKPISATRDYFKSKRRKRIVITYSKTKELKPADHFVVDEYQEKGSQAVPDIRAYSRRMESYNRALDTVEKMEHELASKFGKEEVARRVSFRRPTPWNVFSKQARLRGLESTENGRIIISPEIGAAVDTFERFLRGFGERIPDKPSEVTAYLAPSRTVHMIDFVNAESIDGDEIP